MNATSRAGVVPADQNQPSTPPTHIRTCPWGRRGLAHNLGSCRRPRLELLPIKVKEGVEAHPLQQLPQALLHQLRAVAARRLQLAAHPLQAAAREGVPAGI
jgi:hypothetical protein